MGPQNGIVGDNNPTELPVTQQLDPNMEGLKRAAKFAKSAEWKDQKKYLEGKIAYYQGFLPGEVPPENIPDEERGKYWAIASVLVKEFRAFIDVYEQAAEIVKSAGRENA